MSTSVVVGGQFGGEGKGKVVSYLGYSDRPFIVAKGSGPNSMHRVVFEGRVHEFRMLPAAAPTCDAKLFLGAGALIHLNTLAAEAENNSCWDRLVIDPNAGIVNEKHIAREERSSSMREHGTTFS